MEFALRSLRRLVHNPRAWLDANRDPALQLLRISVAASIAWLVAGRLLTDSAPVLAPLTAVLTVQVTVYRTLATALQRAAGVIAGVLLALAVARLLGLTAASLGLMTGIGLLAGRVLRLREQSTEVAISALLVLAVGAEPSHYAWDRIIETLIGAGVGVTVNIVVVPALFVRSADRTLVGLARRTADLLHDIGGGLHEGLERDRALEWLDKARDLAGPVAQAREALERADESLRYNPRRYRAPGTLRHLVEATAGLEHVAVQVRTVARILADITEAPGDRTAARPGLVPEFADLMTATAEVAGRFAGALEAGEDDDPADATGALREALVGARTGHEAATQAMGVDPGHDPAAWSSNGALLAAAGRMLRELDPDEGPHTEALRPAPAPTRIETMRPMPVDPRTPLRSLRGDRPRGAPARGPAAGRDRRLR